MVPFCLIGSLVLVLWVVKAGGETGGKSFGSYSKDGFSCIVHYCVAICRSGQHNFRNSPVAVQTSPCLANTISLLKSKLQDSGKIQEFLTFKFSSSSLNTWWSFSSFMFWSNCLHFLLFAPSVIEPITSISLFNSSDNYTFRVKRSFVRLKLFYILNWCQNFHETDTRYFQQDGFEGVPALFNVKILQYSFVVASNV